MLISEQQLIQSGICTPAMATKWCEQLNATMERFEINTPERICGFLSQVSHESAGFTATTEGLYYSAAALMRVWPQRFPTLEVAQSYEKKPEAIANRAYCDRMGNGSEASGDGWKYRGRGLIQLTGKSNYVDFSLSCDNEALTKPELVEHPQLAAESAGWFWNKYNLNQLADAKDVLAMTKRINGGTNGLAHRQQLYAGAVAVLG